LSDLTKTELFSRTDFSFYFNSLGDDILHRKWGYLTIERNEKVLLIIHGIGFHSYPYKKIMNYIENDSILVFIMDLRGNL
jgi:alpha-beta hydrolase superfamily lysophospholipase